MSDWLVAIQFGLLAWVLVDVVLGWVEHLLFPHLSAKKSNKGAKEWAMDYYKDDIQRIEKSEVLSREDKDFAIRMLTERHATMRNDFLERATDGFFFLRISISIFTPLLVAFMHVFAYAPWTMVTTGLVFVSAGLVFLKMYIKLESKHSNEVAPFETELFFFRSSDLKDISAFAAKEGISIQNIQFHEFTPEIVQHLRLCEIADRWFQAEKELPLHQEFLPQKSKQMNEFSEENVVEWTSQTQTQEKLRRCVTDLRTAIQKFNQKNTPSMS